MILIGSRALLFRAPEILSRKPEDFDFIGREDEILKWLEHNSISNFVREDNRIVVPDQQIEFDILQPYSSNLILEDLVIKDESTIYSEEFGIIPNLDLLFCLKASHRYLKDSPHFWKTVIDYHRMKSIGAKIRPEYMGFFKLREKETYARQAHPKLNVNKKEFFDESFGVRYQHDHDDVHQSIALGEKPAYTYYLKDGAEINCDKDKFFALDEKVRLAGVIEEACVLSIERSLVPHPGVMTPKQAWTFALSKVCSSITSGWFREYAYENIFEVMKRYPENYWERFQQAVKEGKVRKVKNEK
jgi:hypothetical protein